MIENLKIDGFKSLKDFEIQFHKGINVIIGPNGVGKTNICQALAILSSLTTKSLNETFTQFGGVKSTFNSVDCKPGEKRIVISAKGQTSGQLREEFYELIFNYKIELTLSEELYISEETLEIKRKSKKGSFKKILTINNKDKRIQANIHDSELIGDMKVVKKNEKSFIIELDENGIESFLLLMSKLFFVCHLVTGEFFKIKSHYCPV